MKRILLVAALGIGYVVFRTGAIPALPAPPTPTPTPAVSFPAVSAVAKKMRSDDRAALADAYLILSRSIAANPTLEPVFPDTAAVRRAHRAALLYVWAAVLQNRAGDVPGLREALEQSVASRIGTEDVPLNPELQGEAAKAFADLATSLR
jgi:hypothetical protein